MIAPPLLTHSNIVDARGKEHKPLKRHEPTRKVRRIQELRDEAIRWRDGRMQMQGRWLSHRSWYLATGNSGGLMRQRSYINHIYEKVESLGAALADAPPTFHYRPPTKSRVRLANHLNRSVPTIWQRERGPAKYRGTVKKCLIYGTDYWYIGHELSGPNRMPRVTIDEIPAWRVFPAPGSVDPETAPWFFIAVPRTREEIFRDYRKKVDPDEFPQAELGHIEDDLSEVDKTAPVYGSRPDSMDTTTTYAGEVPLHQGSFLGHNGNQKDIVWQWILFVNDNAEENEYWIEKTKGGADLAWGPTLKYPNGRIMSIAGDVELFDRHNPYPDTGLVRFRDVPQDNFWFGLSDIPPLIELQRLHDDMMENIRLVHRFMANSRLIIDKTTGLQPGEIGNDPDEIWWTQNATHDRVRIQEGIVPRAEFYGHLSFLEAKFDLLSGHTDALRGMNPPNVQAARHFGQLQRAAATRVRGRLRDMEDSLVEAGRMIARRVQQFYPSYTEARVNDDRFESLELSQEDREGDFDIEVSLIANLDEMRAAEFQQLLVLHKMGVVSDERLIEDSGLSSSQTLLAELPEVRQQRQMQMMAMAAQQNAEEQGGMDASDAAQSSSNTQRNVARATKGGRK